MAGRLGIAARVFAALAAANINIVAIAQGSSELNISFVVAAKDVGAAQRAVHGAFQLSKIGGGAAARAAHTDAVLLGFGQIGRALAEIMSKGNSKGRGKERGMNGGAEAAPGGGDRSARVRVRSQRPPPRAVAALARRRPGKSAGRWAGWPSDDARRRAGGARRARAQRSNPGRRHRRREHAPHPAGAGRRDGRGAGQQASHLRPARRERGAGGAGGARRAAPLDRGDRRRRAADLRHPPQAGRVGRSRARRSKGASRGRSASC